MADGKRPRRAVRFADWVRALVIEIFFSIVQRKVLAPAAAHDLDALGARIRRFEGDYCLEPRPIRWCFTRADFDRRLLELAA